MLAICKTKPQEGVTIADVDIPKIKKDEVLLKIKATSICGTDVHIYEWDDWAAKTITKLPLIFGHEVAGEVVEVGKDVKNLKVGDFVSAESHITCGKCYYCKNGMRHICEDVKVLGIHRDGTYAEYVSIPAVNAWRQDKSMPPEIASIHEPLGNAVHAVLSVDVKGKNVVIFGCGPIGLWSIGISKALGAKKVIAVDVNKFRLGIAMDMKADVLVNPALGDTLEEIWKCFKPGADIVFEMSGSPSAYKTGLECLKKGGTFVAFGISHHPIEIDMVNNVVMKEINIKGIFGRVLFKSWEQMRDILSSGKFDPTPVITHRFSLSQFDKAMEAMRSNKIKCGKVVLFP